MEILAIAVVAALAGGMGAQWWGRRGVDHRLELLQSAAGVLASGSLPEPLEEEKGGETTALAHSLNVLARVVAEEIPSPHGRWKEGLVELRRERDRLRALVEAAGEAVVVTDLHGGVVEWNRRVTEYFGEPPRSLLRHGGGDKWSRLAAAEDWGRIERLLALPEESDEGRLALNGVTPRILRWRSVPLQDAERVVRGRLFLFQDDTELRRLDQLQQEFISAVSHELRTPLTSIKGALQLVLSGSRREGSESLLEISLKNTERLIGAINDLLDISRLETGRLDLNLATVDVRSVVAAALEDVRALADTRQISLDSRCDDALPTVYGDAGRLQQVAANLLSNAIRFSPPGGRVAVCAQARQAGVQVEVQDWGMGIAAEDQPNLFRRFSRLRPREEDGGLGLGLAIARAIVERHGGRIWVESSEGAGARFSFFLPVSIYRAEADAGDAAQTVPHAGRTVLIIEDDADVRTVLAMALRGTGLRVHAVERGLEGIEAARIMRPDVIILDLVLPDVSGYDVLRILRHSPETEKTPVVVASVKPDPFLGRRVGATEVLTKPLDINEVCHVLSRALDRGAAEKQRRRVLLGSPASRDISALATALAAAGHEVHRAAGRRELAARAAETSADLIVLDEDLEEAADQTVAFLHRDPLTAEIPVVFVTSERGGNGCGAVRLPKPLAAERFVEQVEAALAAGKA